MSYQVGYAFYDKQTGKPMTEIVDETYFIINLFATKMQLTKNGPVTTIEGNLSTNDCSNWPLAD
jgi:hypothetical protein